MSRNVVGSVTSTRFCTRSAFAVPEKLIVVAKSTKDKQHIFFIWDRFNLAVESLVIALERLRYLST